MTNDLADIEYATQSIQHVRGQRVILDAALAALYGVSTKRLNEQVKRNTARFPSDFMFRLTESEVESLNRSQIATGSRKHRDPRFPPFAFTEHGAIQAANVLNTAKAISMGVLVVRAFVRLRELLASNKELAQQLKELEKKYAHHDEAIRELFTTIRHLLSSPKAQRRGIGFTADVQ